MRLTTAAFCVTLSLIACGAPAQYGRPLNAERPPPVRPAPNEKEPPAPGAGTFTYVCDDLTRIAIVEGDAGTATATLNSGLALALSRRGPGHYGAPPYEFRAFGGGDAQWFNNGKMWRCRFG
jgi:hypothetical protein